MKREFKHWGSTIPPMSTKRTITSRTEHKKGGRERNDIWHWKSRL